MHRFACGLLFVTALGCSSKSPDVDLDTTTDGEEDTVMVACTEEGAEQCSANVLQRCTGGFWQTVEDCALSDLVCVDGLGCVVCVPDRHYCEGDVEMVCDEDGMGASVVQDCAELDTDGTWNDEDCLFTFNAFVCESPDP